ncbi:IclR family transcriptional regulator [Streptomyces sp. NPDC060030]|uniref:IclR family transcriptional regulator n=1 Tax=Streptomyces sp. NPDC060030 TaxID=3347042 RepID=UPI0036C4C8ED
MRTHSGESVLARAVRIFEAFTPEEPNLTVSEIARRTGLHVATASRLVAELVSHGFLARDADRRARIGLRMWELVTRASPALSPRDAAMPFMEGVHDVVGHHVQLGVLDGDEVLFLERLSAPGAVINYTRIAGRLPLHASSSGLVLLAHGPADLRERLLVENSSPVPRCHSPG